MLYETYAQTICKLINLLNKKVSVPITGTMSDPFPWFGRPWTICPFWLEMAPSCKRKLCVNMVS